MGAAGRVVLVTISWPEPKVELVGMLGLDQVVHDYGRGQVLRAAG